MEKTAAAPKPTPPSLKGGASAPTKNSEQYARQRGLFLSMALNMSWQLAVVVLVPIIGGAQLDKHLDTSHVFLFIGLALAALGSTAVMWRTMQLANKLPVPKLTEAQKRAIKKSYEEDDD